MTVNVTEALKLRLIGQSDLGGHGDAMHVNVVGSYAYVGHMGYSSIGTSIVDISNPENPQVVHQIMRPKGTHTHKVQVVDNILLVNHERNPWESNVMSWSAGLAIYDISNPRDPRQLAFHETPGAGVHRMTYWEAPYAYLTASDEGYLEQFLQIVDLSDPTNPREVGRWWYPGQHTAGGEVPNWTPTPSHMRGPNGEARVCMHHALVRDGIAYCGWWDAGLVILDVSDATDPKMLSHLPFGEESSATHTALPVPGKDYLIVTDEQLDDSANAQSRDVRVVDVADVKNPKVVARFPVPSGTYPTDPGRFGPHNLHEPRPGSLIDGTKVYLTYFNAGLRVFDISDPLAPRESAYFVPQAPEGQPAIQLNDLTVAGDGRIYVTDRFAGGLYILEHTGS